MFLRLAKHSCNFEVKLLDHCNSTFVLHEIEKMQKINKLGPIQVNCQTDSNISCNL